MSVKKLGFLAVLVSVAPGVSAQLDVQVEPVSCPGDTNPLVTIPQPNATTGNPGGPQPPERLYRNKVCVGNVEAPTMRDSCPGTPGFYLYSQGTEAHFSNTSVYPTEVCTGRLQVTLRSLDTNGDGTAERSNPCESGEKQLFSVSNHTNAHIASPYNDFYRFKACGSLRSLSPESVEVRLSLSSDDEVRSDDEPLDPGDQETSLDYPYVASSDGSKVSALVSRSADTAALRQDGGQNTLVLRANATADSSLGGGTSTSVLVPFTQGGFSSVEQREDAITEGRLLGTRNPTFGFPNLRNTDSYRTTYLEPEFNLTSNLSVEPGSYQLELEKTGDNQIGVTIR